jgi:hypothetical protein
VASDYFIVLGNSEVCALFHFKRTYRTHSTANLTFYQEVGFSKILAETSETMVNINVVNWNILVDFELIDPCLNFEAA